MPGRESCPRCGSRKVISLNLLHEHELIDRWIERCTKCDWEDAPGSATRIDEILASEGTP